MDKIKPLFTATATAVGGRNGHSESSDGIVAVDLSVPKEMGGPGKPGTATPEHLFAAGAMEMRRETGNRDAGAPFRRGLCGLFRRRDRLRGETEEEGRK